MNATDGFYRWPQYIQLQLKTAKVHALVLHNTQLAMTFNPKYRSFHQYIPDLPHCLLAYHNEIMAKMGRIKRRLYCRAGKKVPEVSLFPFKYASGIP